MEKEISDILWEDASELDEAIVKLGDALDVKASIVLILVTLLGAISGPILVLAGLPQQVKIAQCVAVAALTLAVYFSLVVLWPSDFSMPPDTDSWEQFIWETGAEQQNNAQAIATELRASRIRLAKKRIASNQKITVRKARFNQYAFYATAAAIVLDVATLIWLAYTHF